MDNFFLPGKELDQLVATLVMGWKKHKDGDVWVTEENGWTGRRVHAQTDEYDGEPAWSPSTDLCHAWDVVEKLMPACGDGSPEINRAENSDGTKCWHVYFEGGDKGHAFGDTVMLAICRAALQAVEEMK